MNTDAILAKYADALLATVEDGQLHGQAIALALRLAVQDAYAAGAALADDLAAIVASQAQATPDQRQAESAINQIGRLNEWLAEEEPALCADNNLDTAAAILKAIRNREHDLVIAYADNADLLNKVHQAQVEIDRLTRQNVIATDTFNSLAERTNGAGANPTTAPDWNRSHPAWEGMTDAEHEAVYALTKSKARFGELSMELRSEILRRVLSYTITGSEQRLTMARFDQCKPEWMPQASGLVKYFGGSWSKLLNLDLTPA